MIAEFRRIVRVHDIGGVDRTEEIAAGATELQALAGRFDLLSLNELTARLLVRRDATGIRVGGRFVATGEQACSISAESVPFALDEPVDLCFSDHAAAAGDEVELAHLDLDMLPLDGDDLDLGEAVAQSLGLALDPYPRSPEAGRGAAARFVISEEEAEARVAAEKRRTGPFSGLARR